MKVLQFLFVVVLVLSLFFKAVYFHIQTRVYNESIKTVKKANFGSALILMAFVLLISFNHIFLIGIVADIAISILIFADIMFAKYYYNPLNVTVIFYQMRFLGDIKNSMSALFDVKDLKLFLDIPFLVVAALILKEPTTGWEIRFVAFIMFVVGLILVKLSDKECVKQKYSWEKEKTAGDLGVLYYHFTDICYNIKNIFSSKEVTKQEKEKVSDCNYKPENNEYSGIYEGKNLIVIQLEAMQGFAIGAEIDGKEVTPNLNKLINKSIYANNLYYQANYGNTCDAEFIINNSLYPSVTGTAYYQYPANTYFSLAKAMRKKGYYSAVFHGYERDFWNRPQMYESMGYERYFSKDDFKSSKNIGFGINDSEFFRQSLDYLVENAKDKPFYGFFISLSSHHPYHYDYGTDFKAGKYEGTMLGDFFKGANYVDKAIGELIEYMKEKGIYDDTVMAIYGDHAALFTDEADNLCDYMGVEYNNLNWNLLQKIPFIVTSGEGIGPVRIEKTAGQIDILPTIANLMGADLSYCMGKDLLSNEEGYAILPRGNLITDKFAFISEEHKFYDLKTRKDIILSEEELAKIEKFYKKRETNRVILEKDALKN